MEDKKKTPGELRREALCCSPKNGYDRLTPADEAAMKGYCDDYKKFLDNGKTEREVVDTVVALAEGVNIGAAHLDSPRLDLKQNPL